MSSLPEEIQEDILLRLPLKSILRFKSICKNWYALTAIPKFVKDHFILANKNPKIMIKDFNFEVGRDMFYSLSADSILSASLSCKCEGAVPMKFPVIVKNGVRSHYYKFLGSCNGLLCLGSPDSNAPILWNPLTKEYKETPDQKQLLPHWSCYYGFGYDSKTDDFKLVRIGIAENEVYVYTLRSNTWRRVNGIPYKGVREFQGLFVNGALHWTCDTATDETSKDIDTFDICSENFILFPEESLLRPTIIAFDVSSEKFINLPFPEEIVRRPTDRCLLRNLGDCLCIVSGIPEVRLDVWMMQNYGAKESWTKRFTTTNQSITQYPLTLKLYWDFVNGDILIQVHGRFALYDQKNDKARFLNINHLDDDSTLRTYLHSESYMESFVSLNSGTYTGLRS